MFPQVDFMPRGEGPVKDKCRGGDIVFEERTRLRTRLGCCEVRLTLEKNSRMEMLCPRRPPLKVRDIRGGAISVVDGAQVIAITEPTTRIALEAEPGAIYALALRMAFPADMAKGDEATVVVAQVDAEGPALGGATAIYRVA
jgi:hypothetical protein